MAMYHAEFYKNSGTGAVTYSLKEAMGWKESGHQVLHYHTDGSCTVI